MARPRAAVDVIRAAYDTCALGWHHWQLGHLAVPPRRRARLLAPPPAPAAGRAQQPARQSPRQPARSNPAAASPAPSMLLRALLLASAHTVLVDAAAAPTKKRVMVWTTEDAANTK